MDALRQRLKELDSHMFQAICFDILKEKYPNLTLRHVEGAAGDEGLDLFEGELLGKPTIWQCKSFPNGVSESQKKQIRKSLNTALSHFSPSNWILCISVDMGSKAQRWFEKWKMSHKSNVIIGQFPASDILHELIYRRSIRNHYFPNAVLDPIELRRLITRTGELSLEELEHLTENNLEHFIERLKERDARCNYQIVFDGDFGPPVTGHMPRPGLMMSMSNGQTTIHVFARDLEALRSNPPAFQVEITEAGMEKYRELMKTGTRQEFASHEFGSFTSNWPVLAPMNQQSHGSQARLIIGPSPALTNRQRSVRVKFRGSGEESIEYALMDMRPTRVGTEEAEFVCSGRNLPFRISVILPSRLLAKTANIESAHETITDEQITFQNRIVGSNSKQAKKFLDAMALLQPTGEIEIFDLQEDNVLFTAKVELEADSPSHQACRKFVNDIAQIADRFNVDLRVPPKVLDEDLRAMLLLKTFMESGYLAIGNISATLVKSEENKDLLTKNFASGTGHFRFAYPFKDPKPMLFGVAIDTGPCAIELDAEIVNLATTLEDFRNAAIGGGVQVLFRPINPARFILLSAEDWSKV